MVQICCVVEQSGHCHYLSIIYITLVSVWPFTLFSDQYQFWLVTISLIHWDFWHPHFWWMGHGWHYWFCWYSDSTFVLRSYRCNEMRLSLNQYTQSCSSCSIYRRQLSLVLYHFAASNFIVTMSVILCISALVLLGGSGRVIIILTPLTFAWHCLSPLAVFTSSAYFLHNERQWQWICGFYRANFKGIFGDP